MEPDGEMRPVFRAGESRLPPDGALRTFHNPVLIPDGPLTHLIYHRNYARAFICSSEDGGKSWHAAREITDAYRGFPYAWTVCATGPGHGVRMKSGRLAAAVWLAQGALRPDGRTRRHQPSAAGCIYSDDRGQTWHAGAFTKAMLNGNETALAQLPGGALLLNFRNMNPEHRRVLGLSATGETLSRVWPCPQLEDPGCFGGMAETEDGVLFANCASESRRVNALVRFSPDAGESWQPLWQVDSRAGYIDIACARGRVYAFYERYSEEKRLVEELVLKIGRAWEDGVSGMSETDISMS